MGVLVVLGERREQIGALGPDEGKLLPLGLAAQQASNGESAGLPAAERAEVVLRLLRTHGEG